MDEGSPDIVVCSEPWERADIVTFLRDWMDWDFVKYHAQEVIFRAIYDLPMTQKDREFYAQITGDTTFKCLGHGEKQQIQMRLGARGGKSESISGLALFESTRPRWRQYVKPGEYLYCIITATSLKQAQDVVQMKCTQRLYNSKLAHLAATDKASMTRIVLKNANVIQSFPYNDTAARGLPAFMLIFDEVAHYRKTGPREDNVVYDSLRPRLSQVQGGKEAFISTPATKTGLFWDLDKESVDALAAGCPLTHRFSCHAPTWVTNPSVDMALIKDEYRRNPDNARREFGAEFAESLTNALRTEDIDTVRLMVDEIPPDSGQMYFAGIDQSGLSGRDRFSMAVAHMDTNRHVVVVNCVLSWDTKDADELRLGIKQLVSRYSLWETCIDRYAGGWVAHFLKSCGLEVVTSPMSGVAFTNFKSKLLAHELELPFDPGLYDALKETDICYGQGRTISVIHPRTSDGHGDKAEAAFRAVWMCGGDEERADRPAAQSYREAAIAKAEEQYDPLMDGLR